MNRAIDTNLLSQRLINWARWRRRATAPAPASVRSARVLVDVQDAERIDRAVRALADGSLHHLLAAWFLRGAHKKIIARELRLPHQRVRAHYRRACSAVAHELQKDAPR